ncbi:hypothetical protein [Desulfosporosinus sp. Sb-LF]|uniref:hypothetical protein n=1 Tax=Desulfosporosinus sp. Sb-LF TaxID=2560027 RepID=UPI00107FC66D|nr:hypothetical protein [Desulfosporosinus sp. Sb-LF]TGE31634.1 hypothetical protein E4K68_16415 [Desulfosporosinus sp. Sb-LF]
MSEEVAVDCGVRYTRGNFLNVVPVPPFHLEGARNYKFELYNNRAKSKRPVATLTTSVGTVLRSGVVKRSFIGTLEIRPDVPFSQLELNDLPTDIATLMFRELGGNPAEEEFIVIIRLGQLGLEGPHVEEVNNISESWMGGEINFKHYSIFTGRSVIIPSG